MHEHESTKYYTAMFTYLKQGVHLRLYILHSISSRHNVPYSIDEVNALYLFGLNPESGYEAIWSLKNEIPLHKAVEQARDTARIIIVRDEDNVNELKMIVLDKTILGIKVMTL